MVAFGDSKNSKSLNCFYTISPLLLLLDCSDVAPKLARSEFGLSLL